MIFTAIISSTHSPLRQLRDARPHPRFPHNMHQLSMCVVTFSSCCARHQRTSICVYIHTSRAPTTTKQHHPHPIQTTDHSSANHPASHPASLHVSPSPKLSATTSVVRPSVVASFVQPTGGDAADIFTPPSSSTSHYEHVYYHLLTYVWAII